VDGLITNFHLPKSALLMLVCALAGRERVLSAYREAVDQRCRFFCFGDAMLIIIAYYNAYYIEETGSYYLIGIQRQEAFYCGTH
jgi:hypothetical protein